MAFEITYSAFAQKQLDKMDQSDVKIIIKTIGKRLTLEPDKAGKPLGGGLKGYLKLKFGQYRVVYTVHKAVVKVEVAACGLRKDIYEKFLAKLKQKGTGS